jgi:flagellar P-ring protein precursor FlgI
MFRGSEAKQLIGYGLIVGLNGTGDGGSSQITIQSIKNMMERFGNTVPSNKIRPNNVAAVMVTASLPAFSKQGSQVDVTVSSIGDARSLEGGTLLLTSLIGTDGEHYATAQGAVSIGGFNTGTKGGGIRKNYTLVGRIPGGALVEKDSYQNMVSYGEMQLNLRYQDFSTASSIADKINNFYKFELATPEDAMSVSIIVPDSILVNRRLINFISNIENLEVVPQQHSRVVINERTGTIVAGGNVVLNEVAVAHGNLVIKIGNTTQQFNMGNMSETQTMSEVSAVIEGGQVMTMEAVSVRELAQSLNAIKVSPRDLISIFQSLRAAGALHADLVII